MEAIAETLEVARSNIIERQKGDRRSRGSQIRPGDVELAADIRRLVDQRPTYGYRRIAALLKGERRSAGHEPVNAKRLSSDAQTRAAPGAPHRTSMPLSTAL